MKEDLISVISFFINNELFAIDTLKVRNILELNNYTKVPNSKDYILGIMNLHGNVFPVADLRMMMGVEKIANTADTSVIVVSHDGTSDSLIGLVVDSVKEVFEINDGDKFEDCLFNGNTGFIKSFVGSLKREDSYIYVIDINEAVKVIEN